MRITSDANVRRIGGCRRGLWPVSLILGLTAGLGALCAQGADVGLTSADYAAAGALLEGNLQGLVRNESVQPHWIGDSGRFWYQRDGNDGPEFVLVTAAGVKSPAFDHAALALALSAVLGDERAGNASLASLAHAQLSDDLTHLTGQIDKKSVDCNVKTLQCRAFDTPAPAPELLRSPDGTTQVYGKVMVDLRTGKIWGFPTLAPQSYPSNQLQNKPQTSRPFELGRFALEDTNK